MQPTSIAPSDQPLMKGGDTAASRRAPTPSICRMVVYHGHGHPQPEEFPAVIQKVNADGSLNLFVMGAKGHQLVTNAVEGTGVAQWCWPERV